MKTRNTSWTVRASTDLDYPTWVCGPCGRLYGRRIPDGVSTYNQDDCGVCGKNAAVTPPRNFGHLKDGWQNHKAISQPKGRSMKDWADEIEQTIAAAYSSHGAILAADADGMIATALRKAVDDERKMIAEWLRNLQAGDTTKAMAIVLGIAASRIERGEYKKGQ